MLPRRQEVPLRFEFEVGIRLVANIALKKQLQHNFCKISIFLNNTNKTVFFVVLKSDFNLPVFSIFCMCVSRPNEYCYKQFFSVCLELIQLHFSTIKQDFVEGLTENYLRTLI